MEIRLFLKVLVLPPGLHIVLAVLTLLLLWRGRRSGIILLIVNTLLLYGLSIPLVQVALTKPLESTPAVSADDLKSSAAKAIVVLAGATYREAPEYERDSVMPGTLARIQYAAWLRRQTKLPLLVSGGSVYGETAPIAETMALVLTKEFKVPVRWIENASRNTKENADLTAALLLPKNIDNILLITDASHMPRASRHFKQAGFTVTAAPTRFYSRVNSEPRPWAWFYPSTHSFERSVAALHEYLGLLIARLE